MAEGVPKNGEFLDGKLWFHRKGTLVTVGLTNHAIDELGAVQNIELPDEGDDFTKGDSMATVEGNSGSVEVIAPASGVIQEVNQAATDDPDRVSEDPLEEGWLVKIEVQDITDLQEFV